MIRILVLLTAFSAQLAFANPRIPLEKEVEPPGLLSQTGLFQGDVKLLIPAEDLRPFLINQPLWTDFARKRRFLYLPSGKHIGFSENEAWQFPIGTILVKHFEMEISIGVLQNVETRILVRKEGDGQNWVGYTYRWEGADAILVDAKASPEVTLNVDVTAEGGARVQKFQIPSRRMCLDCHNSSVGFVRGVQTRQLQKIVGESNQLDQWNLAGVFGRDIGPASRYSKFPGLGEATAPIEERAKAYLDVNCSHCHNPDPDAYCSFTGLDFRFDHVNADALVASGQLVKGAKEHSEIYRRMDTTQQGMRMPFTGTRLKHTQGLELIGRWIDGLN